MLLSAETSDVLAIWTLVVLAFAGLVWLIVLLSRSPFSPLQSALYALIYVITRLLWRTVIENRFPIEARQGAVIVCNHRCPVDPAFILLGVPRVVHWMVAREYYEYPGFHGLLQLCETIPVGRGGTDTAATKVAMRYLKAKELIGIFPEGRINTTGQTLLPGRPGAALIALRSGAPIVPCCIEGSPYNGTTLGCLLMPAQVRVRFGTPIATAELVGRQHDREAVQKLTRQFLQAIAELAGDADYQPKLAGRVYKPNA